MNRIAVAASAALAAAALLAGAARAQTAWPDADWNPVAAAGDLALPLPCGGQMAFRPIPTPLPRGALADRPATFGQADPETDYAEYLRAGFVAGPFPGPSGEPPRYYLAKYEVTRDQWDAVMTEPCPALPSQGGRVPKGDISWHEAVAFTAKMTSYVMAKARAKLPKRDDALAFVRLPTEDEWEYAARGGAAVSETDFGARTYPMDGGIAKHAWFQGPRSAAGRLRPVGTRDANPLGLHDVYGSVAEWVLEPFRLNKVGRPHGQAGGTVARGGDFLTSEDALRSSLRIELPPFDVADGAPLRLRNVGMRPALGLVATTADARVTEFRAAFEAEAQSRSSAVEDPAKLLEVMRKDATDPAVRQGIAKVEATLRAETRARAEQEQQTVRSQIEAAATLARQVFLVEGYGKAFAPTSKFLESLAPHVAEQLRGTVQNLGTRLGDQATAMDRGIPQVVASYLRVVTRVGRSAERTRIADEVRVVVEELKAQNLPGMPELAQLAGRHMVMAAGGNPPTPEAARRDINEAAARPAAPAPPARR